MTFVLKDHRYDQYHYALTTITVPIATKLSRIETNFEVLPCIVLLDPLIMWFCKIMWQNENIIVTTTMSMATKIGRGYEVLQDHKISTSTVFMTTNLGRLGTYLEWVLPIKSHDHMIKWPFEITSQTKILRISLYSVRMRENTDQNNSE